MRGGWVVGACLAAGLACGGGAGEMAASSPAPVASAATEPCVAACEARRASEANEADLIAAECHAACGVGPAAQPIGSEPGWWVVRGKLDAVDEAAPDELPNSGVGILAGNAAYSLFCELEGAGDLYGRQVWTRAKRVSAADPPEGETIAMRDCQGLSLVDEVR